MLRVELGVLLGLRLAQALCPPQKQHRRVRLGKENEREEGARPREDHHDPEDPAPAEEAHG